MFSRQTEVTCSSRAQGKQGGNGLTSELAAAPQHSFPARSEPSSKAVTTLMGKEGTILVTEARGTHRQVTVTGTATHMKSCVPQMSPTEWGQIITAASLFSERDSDVFMSYLASGLRY